MATPRDGREVPELADAEEGQRSKDRDAKWATDAARDGGTPEHDGGSNASPRLPGETEVPGGGLLGAYSAGAVQERIDRDAQEGARRGTRDDARKDARDDARKDARDDADEPTRR